MKLKKRWWILITLVVIPICGIFIFRYHCQAEFNRRVEALAAKNIPVSLDSFEKKYVLSEDVPNAASIYIEAFSFYCDPNELERKFLPIRGDYCWTDDVLPLPTEVMNTLKSSLKANQKTLELIDEATPIDYCLFPRFRETNSSSKNEYLSNLKNSDRLLCERNLYLAQTHQTSELFKTMSTLLKFSRRLDKQGYLIDDMVGVSFKALATDNLKVVINQNVFNEAQLKDFQLQFIKMQDTSSYSISLINERCGAIEFFCTHFNDRDHTSEKLSAKRLKKFYYLTGLEKKESLFMLDYLQDYIDASMLPVDQWPDAFEKIQNEIRDRIYWQLYSSELMLYCKIAQIRLRVLGQLRCTETALAVERYRLKYDALPESLEALVPEFMEAVPLEPFDGQPLRYIRREGGYTVYTIGEDGVDNGGWSKEQMAEETGEENPKEYDWPFTVRR